MKLKTGDVCPGICPMCGEAQLVTLGASNECADCGTAWHALVKDQGLPIHEVYLSEVPDKERMITRYHGTGDREGPLP